MATSHILTLLTPLLVTILQCLINHLCHMTNVSGDRVLKVTSNSCFCCFFKWLISVSLIKIDLASSFAKAVSSSTLHSLCEGTVFASSKIFSQLSLLSVTFPSHDFATPWDLMMTINSSSELIVLPSSKAFLTTDSIYFPVILKFFSFFHSSIWVFFACTSTALNLEHVIGGKMVSTHYKNCTKWACLHPPSPLSMKLSLIQHCLLFSPVIWKRKFIFVGQLCNCWRTHWTCLMFDWVDTVVGTDNSFLL